MEWFPCPRGGELAAVNISRFHCSCPSLSQDPSTEPTCSPAAEGSESSWGCWDCPLPQPLPPSLSLSPLHPGRDVCSGGCQETNPSSLCFDPALGPQCLAGLALPGVCCKDRGELGEAGCPAPQQEEEGTSASVTLSVPLNCHAHLGNCSRKQHFWPFAWGATVLLSQRKCAVCIGACLSQPAEEARWGPGGEREPRRVTGRAQHWHCTADVDIYFPSFLTLLFNH